MAMQYGGWYDNPATGKNQRWFNGVWTDGSEPGQASGGGGIPMPDSFSFDYAAEAEKAYGELGAYYDRVLKESEGDLNKALSRLTQDYDRGMRISKEDTQFAKEGQNLSNQERLKQADLNRGDIQESGVRNALSRGVYQESLYGDGFGIGEEQTNKNLSEFNAGQTYQDILVSRAGNQLDLGQTRYEETANLGKGRTTEDLKTNFDRYKYDQEQQRRKEAASLANNRGQSSYQKYQYQGLYNPSMV